MDKEEINKRIKYFIDYLGISQSSFAKEIGTSPPRINNITKFRNRPDSNILQLILFRYRNLNSDWLLTGTGEMLKKPTDEENKAEITSKDSSMLTMLNKKDEQIIKMSEEIGMLKEQIRSLKKQIGYTSLPIAAEPGAKNNPKE